MLTRSSWLNCALRDDEAVYWVSISDVQIANRLGKKSPVQAILKSKDTTEAISRLRICQIVLQHTVILHSKITPNRPQITPDHTKSSQEHAFGTHFLTGPRQKKILHCPTPPPGELPKPRESPHTSNGLSVAVFRFKSEKSI